MTTLQQQAESDSAPWLIANRNAETLSAGAIFGKRQAVTSGLTWGYYGGLYNGNTVADGTVTLTNAATNYVVVLRSTGVVSVSTTTTNSLDPLYAKLYALTVAGSVVTVEVDQRTDANGLQFNAGSAGGGAYADDFDVRDFGTLNNNGTTDDSAVFVAAATSGARVIHAENLNCAITSMVDIPDNQVWVLSGSTFTMTSTTAAMFRANLVDDWALIGPFIIIGPGSTIGTAKGVHVIGCNRWRIDGMTARTVRGWGLYIEDGAESGTLRGDQGHIQNFRAESCYIGYQDAGGSAAEYGTLEAPFITGCGTGLITVAGNVQVMGGHIVDNTGDGVQVNAGTNHAHGQFIGVNINHNGGYDLRCTGVVNGEDFLGCHFYEGGILLDGCKGVVIRGGHFDGDIVNDADTGSGQNYLLDAYCPGAYGTAGGGVIAVSGDATSALTIAGLMGAGAPSATGIFCTLQVALSDEATAVTTGTAKVTFRMPHAMTLFPGNAGARLAATTAPTGSTAIIDINEAGSTILSTKLTLDAGEKTSTTAAAPPVISDVNLADDAEITVDFDQVGSTIAGAGYKLLLRGTRPVAV